jgi:glycosyltransferase involved in cell wall biosynthesis
VKQKSNPVDFNKFDGGFTILMAVYAKDDIQLFEKAVYSVFLNSIIPDAFILVVDGPVPDLMSASISSLIDRYKIDPIYLSKNIGLSGALNIGLGKVSTRWVVRADADDYNLANRFSLQASAINSHKKNIDIIGGAILEIDKQGNHLGVRRTVCAHDEILSFLKRRNPFNHMTVAFRVDIARKCGGYPNIYLKEDYALWAKMISEGAYTMNLPNILVHATAGKDMYRRRGGFRYALAEISLQRYLVSLGLKHVISALIDGVCRSFIFILPPVMRGLIYKKVLRSKG